MGACSRKSPRKDDQADDYETVGLASATSPTSPAYENSSSASEVPDATKSGTAAPTVSAAGTPASPPPPHKVGAAGAAVPAVAAQAWNSSLSPGNSAGNVPTGEDMNMEDSSGTLGKRSSDPDIAIAKEHVQFDVEATEKLRQFGKRNRPKKDTNKFATHSGGLDSGTALSPITQEPEGATALAAEPAHNGSGVLLNLSEVAALTTDIQSAEPKIDEGMVRYDIFDNLDAERVKEFEDMFKKVRDASNYEEHKKKSKKHDPNKFSTCTGVVNFDEATGMSLIS